MLQRRLYAFLLAFLLQPAVQAVEQNVPAFLNDNELKNPKEKTQDVLEHKPVTVPSCEQFPKGPIETTSCDFETVESVADDLYDNLQALVKTPFFKFYRADLYRECPFWQENGLCSNRQCGVTTVDESEIPEGWRAAALSKIEASPEDDTHRIPGCYYRDSDFCFQDDTSEGEYVDLTLNPERFTGYSGPSASRIWSTIYQENCFRPPSDLLSQPVDEQCLEEKVYYKLISGLHASISMHICYEHFDQKTGTWGPNLPCFIHRIASHPERLENIYFNAILLLRAVSRIGPYLSAHDYCGMETGEHLAYADSYTLEKLNKVVSIAQEVGRFDEKTLFQGENALVRPNGVPKPEHGSGDGGTASDTEAKTAIRTQTLKDEFKQHFRNVSRIMDCVGCDKCRLWGKLQTAGVGTALKVLFELDHNTLDPKINHQLLSRSEVVALMNTLNRFTESLVAVNRFRTMWAVEDERSQGKLLDETVETGSEKIPRSQRSPTAGENSAFYLDDVQDWIRACRESTVFCFRGLVAAIQQLLDTIFSFFLSDKKNAPHSEL